MFLQRTTKAILKGYGILFVSHMLINDDR